MRVSNIMKQTNIYNFYMYIAAYNWVALNWIMTINSISRNRKKSYIYSIPGLVW